MISFKSCHPERLRLSDVKKEESKDPEGAGTTIPAQDFNEECVPFSGR
jgi:hypothetical protein